MAGVCLSLLGWLGALMPAVQAQTAALGEHRRLLPVMVLPPLAPAPAATAAPTATTAALAPPRVAETPPLAPAPVAPAPAQRRAEQDWRAATLPPPVAPAPAPFAVMMADVARTQAQTAAHAPVSMMTFVSLAVAWYPSIREELERIEQQSAMVGAAQAGYLPQIDGGIRTQMRSDADRHSERRVWQSLNLSISQMLYDFGKVSASVDLARADERVARAGLLGRIDEVARETAGAVLEAQRYDELLQVAREQVDGVAAIAALARRRNELGASNLSDSVQAQARLAAAQSTVLAMTTERARWLSAVQSLAGLERAPPALGEVPPGLSQACVTAVPQWDRIPEILVARAEQARAQAGQAQAQANGLPTFALTGQSNRALNRMPDGYGGDGVTVALQVSAPLYRGGATSAQQRAAAYGAAAAQASADAVKVRMERRLDETVTRALDGDARAEVLQTRVRSTRQTRDLYRKQYLDLGTRSLLDLLNAEQELHQARLDLIQHRFDMSLLHLDCLQLSGALRHFMGLEGVAQAGQENSDAEH